MGMTAIGLWAAGLRAANDTRRPRPPKGWSARDPDHIPRGRRVLVRVDPAALHPSARAAAAVFGGASPPGPGYGLVKGRWWDSGGYMVTMEGTGWGFTLPRSALVYPIPDNVLPLART